MRDILAMVTAKRVGVAAGVLALALAAWQVWRFRQAIVMVRRVNEWAEQTEIREGLAEREGQDRLIAAIVDSFLPGRYYWAALLLGLVSLVLTSWPLSNEIDSGGVDDLDTPPTVALISR